MSEAIHPDDEVKAKPPAPVVVFNVNEALIAAKKAEWSKLKSNTTGGYKAIQLAIKTCRDLRNGLDVRKKEMTQEQKDFIAKVQSEYKKYYALVEDVEAMLEAEKKVEDDRKLKIRQDKEAADRAAYDAKVKADADAKLKAEEEKREKDRLAFEAEKKKHEADRLEAENAMKAKQAELDRQKAEFDKQKAELDRQAAEQAETIKKQLAEQKAELDRQAAEQAAKKLELDAAQAKLERVQREREQIEANEKAAKEAEAKKIEAEAKAKEKQKADEERNARLAGDRRKIIAFCKDIRLIKIIGLENQESKSAFDKFVKAIYPAVIELESF